MRRVRIYLVTDLHGSPRAAQMILKAVERHRPDLFVAAGDLTNFGPASYARDLLAKVAVPTMAVPGNCDPPEVAAVLDDLKVNVHGRRKEFGGRVYVGVGGATITPFDTLFEMTEEEMDRILRPVMEPGAVLISHAPPHGFVDVEHSGEHVGSTALRAIVEEFRPPVVLCGHIHEARGVARYGPTTIVNPGPARGGYGALVDINGDVRVELV